MYSVARPDRPRISDRRRYLTPADSRRYGKSGQIPHNEWHHELGDQPAVGSTGEPS